MTASSASRSVQSKFDAAWPPAEIASASPSLIARLAPPLRVMEASFGTAPACARSGGRVFWVHLAGLFRSFPEHRGNLRAFLRGSHAACWYVVMYTLEAVERRERPWWCSYAPSPRDCARHAAQAANRSVLHEIRSAVASLRADDNGGLAYVVASVTPHAIERPAW
jgi:hypothetical protein